MRSRQIITFDHDRQDQYSNSQSQSPEQACNVSHTAAIFSAEND